MDDRQKTQEQLIQELREYRALAEQTNDVPYSMDAEGILTYVGPQIRRYGWDPEESVSRSFLDFVFPEDREQMARDFQESIASGDEFPSEFRILHEQGHGCWVEDLGKIHRDETGNVTGMTGVLRDITERKKVEQALHNEQERLHAVFQGMPAFVYLVASDYSIPFANRSFRDLFGDPDAKRCYEILRGRTAPCEHCPTFRVFDTNEPLQWEWTSGAGRTYMMHDMPFSGAEGSPLVMEVGVDITDRKRAEEALRERESLLRSLIENMPIDFWARDAVGRCFEQTRLSVERWGDLRGETVDTPEVDPETLAQWKANNERAMRGEVVREEVELVRRDGHLRDYFNVLAPIHDGEDIVGILGINLDITHRKRAERCLRSALERLEQFEAIVNRSPAVVFLWRVNDDWPVEFVTENVSQFGYTADDLTSGRVSWPGITYPEDIPKLEVEVTRYLQEGIDEFSQEYRLIAKSGEIRWIQDWNLALRDSNGAVTHVQGVIVDITERKEAQEAVQRSEARYRLIAENVTDVIWTAEFVEPVDVSGLPDAANAPAVGEALLEGFRFTYVSPSVIRMIGYDADEMIERNLQDTLSVKSYAGAVETLTRELLDGRLQPFSVELELIAKDEKNVWSETTVAFVRTGESVVSGLLGVTRDITQRKAAEKSLSESEETARALVDAPTESALLLELDGTIVTLNETAAGRLGYSVEGLVGTCIYDATPPEVAGVRRAQADRVIESGRPERLVTERAGSCFDKTVYPVFDAEGKVTRLAVFAQDITEQRKAEEEVQREQQLMRQLLDLQERDRKLVAYEIHDGLAQHLTGAMFLLQAARERLAENPTEAAETVDAGVELVRRSLDEARVLISGLRPPIIDESGIVAAIEHLVCDAQESNGFQIEFTHDVQFDRIAAPLESAIYRIVQESVTNACRHSGSERIEVRLVQQDDQIRMEVQDWGAGFDPEEVPPNRFGLKGIRERARLFGGHAEIGASPGKGTRIAVVLPLVEHIPERGDGESI